MLGWIKKMIRPSTDQPNMKARNERIVSRWSNADKAIERTERLLRASGYYNDRLEGTLTHARDN